MSFVNIQKTLGLRDEQYSNHPRGDYGFPVAWVRAGFASVHFQAACWIYKQIGCDTIRL